MRRIGCFLTTVFISLCAPHASAHKPLPRADWCAGRGMEIVVVDTFDFSSGALLDFKTCLLNNTCSVSPEFAMPVCRNFVLKDCGQTSDDWTVGTKMAVQHCGSHQSGGITPGSDLGTTFYLVTSPANYYEPGHHNEYNIELGLQGVCLRCQRLRLLE